MTELLTFQADAAVIDRLGRELVSKQETALAELVKNAFDADATQVDVVFEGAGDPATLEIRDNGSGMSRDELVDGFLRLASDLKVLYPFSPKFHRQRAGRKGIGRFATQRLGRRLTLTTFKLKWEHGYRLSVNWDRFMPGTPLDAVTVELSELPQQCPGTIVRIENLRDSWSQAQIKRSWRLVLALQQPFPVGPVRGSPEADPGFSVRFIQSGSLFADETIVADMQSEILDHFHAIIELQVDDQGHAAWRITKNRFGQTRDWSPIHHEYRDASDPPPYEHLRNIGMRTHYVILDANLITSLVFTRVRDIQSREGGVRLYRNGFRVVPYGEPEDDWLGLDEAYTKRAVLSPIANRNFFGVIEVNDPEGINFDEHTSREGLIETPAFFELKQLASSTLTTAATAIGAERDRKTRTGSPASGKRVSAKSILDRMVIAAKDAKDAADVSVARTQLEDAQNAAQKAAAVRLDFAAVVAAAVKANPEDRGFASQADRVTKMFDRLDVLTSYLNGVAASRSARSRSPVSLSRAIEDFQRGMGPLSLSMGLSMSIRTPPFDPLYTVPMHQAEIASVLLNLYTNAVKAMKRAGSERKILIVADRIDEPESMVRISFSDTGDGIPEENKMRIFGPFFTTKNAPPGDAPDASHMTGTGLGLWIIDRIALNAGGEVSVVDPPPGYATCFEFAVPVENE